jgi:membrane protease YdiL (CAAX protease family)
MVRRACSAVVFCLFALVVTLAAQGVWTGLLVANLKTSPAIPWSVAVMAVVLWAEWRYAGGAWWPAATSEARRRYRRANPVAREVFAWALLGGLLGLGALVALWLLLGQIVRIPGNPATNYGGYSPLTVVAVVAMASLVGAVTEEAGLRGYMLTRLESVVAGWLAVVIVSVVISPGHGATQGFVLPTLLWYFVSDLLFGSISLMARSILPGITVHAIGLLAFFAVVWPTDRFRHPTSIGAQGGSFWVEAAFCVALAMLCVLALRRLVRVTSSRSTPQWSLRS